RLPDQRLGARRCKPRWARLFLHCFDVRAGCCRGAPTVIGQDHMFWKISRIRPAVSVGVLPTRTPAASSASFFACAVPDEPDTMAPAWPIVLPSGAVNPAT